ncbi:hypothetical protein ACFS07_16280 [Undibacterium arcticum]
MSARLPTKKPCSIASHEGGRGLPLKRISAMIKPPTADIANKPVLVCSTVLVSTLPLLFVFDKQHSRHLTIRR